MATTTNMGLVLPVVSTTPGPTYGTLNNSAFSVIDAHDHTSGKGVPIPPSGLDITSALTFQNNDATNLRSARFYAQTTAFTDATDIGCFYVLGADLYFIDTAGNSIRITENGAISSASFGGITGLVAPATAAFSVDTFTFKSTATEYALIDAGDLRTRRSGETSPNYVGIQSPAALAASYQLTLPAALPASTSFATVSSAGAVATSISTSLGITRAMQAAVGQQVSSSSGVFTDTNTSYANVTNLSASLTSTGRPIQIGLISADNGTSFIGLSATGVNAWVRLKVVVSGGATADIAEILLSPATNTGAATAYFPLSSLWHVYVPAAGTYTFTVQASKAGADSTSYTISRAKLFVAEM